MGRIKSDRGKWEAWVQGMGRYTRRLRELTGMSQEQLANRAGVSQGALSRLEAGRAVHTPLIVVMKVNTAMRAALAALPREALSEELRAIMDDVPTRRIPVKGTGFDDLALTPDPLLTELVRLFWSVPARHREHLLQVVRSLAGVLASPEVGGSARPKSGA